MAAGMRQTAPESTPLRSPSAASTGFETPALRSGGGLPGVPPRQVDHTAVGRWPGVIGQQPLQSLELLRCLRRAVVQHRQQRQGPTRLHSIGILRQGRQGLRTHRLPIAEMAIEHVLLPHHSEHRIQPHRPCRQASGELGEALRKRGACNRMRRAAAPEGITPPTGTLKLMHQLEHTAAAHRLIQPSRRFAHRSLVPFRQHHPFRPCQHRLTVLGADPPSWRPTVCPPWRRP